jgi:hypothetical protein
MDMKHTQQHRITNQATNWTEQNLSSEANSRWTCQEIASIIEPKGSL